MNPSAFRQAQRNRDNAIRPKKKPAKQKKDICTFCHFEIEEATVTDLSLPGKFHVRCITLAKIRLETIEKGLRNG